MEKNVVIDTSAWNQAGEYVYKAKESGDIEWFTGNEEIYWQNEKVYE